VIAGKKGWLYQEIFKKVETEQIQKQVVFTGYIPDEKLPALYSGAKMLVYPSVYEGFGLPPLEAMASGIPVVCSNRSSLPEVVGDGALLVNPLQVDDISDSILLLLVNEEKRNELIFKGKKRAAMFSWEKTVQETLKVYEKVGCK
jgi:glycosyltransferase involved in cell wall biosynthesis